MSISPFRAGDIADAYHLTRAQNSRFNRFSVYIYEKSMEFSETRWCGIRLDLGNKNDQGFA